MHKFIIAGAGLALLAGCATAEREPFDPEADARIGAATERACFVGGAASGSGGGHREIGGYDAFVVGRFNERYLLVFSPGCGDLGPAGAAAVFRNLGDNCRRTGEIVRTFQPGFGLSGACSIQHIYEWDRETDEDEAGESDVE